MTKLNYEMIQENVTMDQYGEKFLTSQVYEVTSLYDHPDIHNAFLALKANVVDLNPALITKCIQGTEQDFIMLMNKAKEFLKINQLDNDGASVILMELFQQCVFGYYILTPLMPGIK